MTQVLLLLFIFNRFVRRFVTRRERHRNKIAPMYITVSYGLIGLGKDDLGAHIRTTHMDGYGQDVSGVFK